MEAMDQTKANYVWLLEYYRVNESVDEDTRFDPTDPDYFDPEDTTRFQIGLFSTEERAVDALTKTKQLPGFRLDEKGFRLGRYVLDRAEWEEGFVVTLESGEEIS